MPGRPDAIVLDVVMRDLGVAGAVGEPFDPATLADELRSVSRWT